MYAELIAHIDRYVSLSEQEKELLCTKLQFLKFRRREHILEAGKLCAGNYFIIKGCVRQYMVNNKLNEQVIQFALESWWIADHESLLNHTPATTNIQTIVASEVLLLTDKNKTYLFERIPKLETYFLMITQKALVASQRRIGFIFNMTDEERYRMFIKLFPGFANRVPQYMLASYLGFTPQFMSRLRAKKVK